MFKNKPDMLRNFFLEDAIESYIKNESALQIKASAVRAYSKYQKYSVRAANHLLVGF